MMRDLSPLFFSAKEPIRLAVAVNMRDRRPEHPFLALAGGEIAALVDDGVDVAFAVADGTVSRMGHKIRDTYEGNHGP